MTDFYREVDSTVAGALNPGEQVLWAGHCLSRLGKQRKATPAIQWMWLLVIPFTGIGLISLIDQLRNGPNLGLVVSVVFLGLGGSMAYGLVSGIRTDNSIYCRKQTVYAITNQRAFVLRHCRTEVPMRSVAWRFVDEVLAEWVELDGRGTVKFRHWDPAMRHWETLLEFSRVGNAYRVAERGQAAMTQANG